MNATDDKVLNSIWGEFFLDKNVRFPEYPVLIEGISVYDAPYGLGIQFRGAANKLVIKGQKSSSLFAFLKECMTGENTLSDIFNLCEAKFDFDDVSSFLKILHANSLLIDFHDLQNKDYNRVSITDEQLQYYNRIVGKTGYNKNGLQIAESIANCKVLVIASRNLISCVLTHLQVGGIQNIGLYYTNSLAENEVIDLNSVSSKPLLAEYNITDLSPAETVNFISGNLDNFQHVIVAFENPSRKFIESINSMCINRNKPALFFCSAINTYEIGPYVIPYGTACYTCYLLRKNSYDSDAVYENIYNDGLEASQKKADENIKGFDNLSANVASGYMVSEFTKLIAGVTLPTLINRIVEYDFLNGSFNTTKITQVPGCPNCSK